MTRNSDFYAEIRESASMYYLADIHVHSPASLDVSEGARLRALREDCRNALRGLTGRGLSAAEYEREVMKAYGPDRFLADMVATRDRVAQSQGIEEGSDWAFVGLTDHNVCAYSCEVSRLAWTERSRNRIHVLPGVELDVQYPAGDEGEAIAHVLCLFRPGLSDSDIRIAIHDASGKAWEPGADLIVDSLPKVVEGLRNHQAYPAICVAAHVVTTKGVREETRMAMLSRLDAAITRIQQELDHGHDPDRAALEARLRELQSDRAADAEISFRCLKLIGDCGFDALQVASEKDEVYYRYLHRYKPTFGRAIPIIASDAHSADGIFLCENGTPYLKLTSASSHVSEAQVFSNVRSALRVGETRFSFTRPGAVQYWIAGFEVTPDSREAASFWPCSKSGGQTPSFFLPLCRNLNTLVGGRGSGKSAAIEALSFVCRPAEYNTIDKRVPPDWYSRAKATLSGCTVRLCFQYVGDEPVDLPKKVLFGRRHFSKSEEHEAVHFSDLRDRELLPEQIPASTVQIFRLGQIEQYAGPDRLRALFDEICGAHVQRIEEEIAQKKQELLEQRKQMVGIAEKLNSLTPADAPLRDYVHRQELLMSVDRAEIRRAYQRIDDLEAAQRNATCVRDDWQQIEADFDLEARVSDARAFFAKHRSGLLRENGDPVVDHEPLVEIVGKDAESAEGPTGLLHRIVESVETLANSLKSVATGLSAFYSRTERALGAARDALQQQGLPTGGKDREARKKALQASQDALSEYRQLRSEWRAAEAVRQTAVQQLRELANKRSELRERTAVEVTEELKADLDRDILVIEARARTQSDTGEFRGWLDSHFSDQSFKYRERRVAALLERGLTPADLRILLSNAAPSDYSLLVVAGNATQGGIDSSVARSLYERCAAVRSLPPDKDESEVEDGVWDECPQEVREGLVEFTRAASGELCVDSVLQLDEITFDDEPVILLNDRPHDRESTLRPLEGLSPGQRCSAILPILLLTGNGPLVIDQPEDNLDNRLVRQVIVNILTSIKLRRQVIVATHNPNVPVLGDVEKAVVLRGVRDRQCVVDAAGDLDAAEVVHHLTNVMEGGREAFQYRQTIYQSHWDESVVQNEITAPSAD